MTSCGRRGLRGDRIPLDCLPYVRTVPPRVPIRSLGWPLMSRKLVQMSRSAVL